MLNLGLGLAGKHQIANASLALRTIETFYSSNNLPSVFEVARNDFFDQTSKWQERTKKGLEAASWPGRCQIVVDAAPERCGVTWFLDGAHTPESMLCCADWFGEAVTPDSRR